jgi:hypothetical protein
MNKTKLEVSTTIKNNLEVANNSLGVIFDMLEELDDDYFEDQFKKVMSAKFDVESALLTTLARRIRDFSR